MLDKFIGQTLSDKYKIEDVLREDEASRTYRGTHLLMEKPITLKILSPALAADENNIKRFSAEARTLSLVSHPNILNVTDFGSDKNGAIYIAMENADGETLKDVLQTEGKFAPERAVEITRQITAALAAAHSGGVVHRHLNSENIFLSRTANDSETVKVLNFGAADSFENHLNVNEIPVSEAEYLAPEQLSASSAVDARSDVYSLGVILYEMLAGEVPFKGETAAEIVRKQTQEPPAPLTAFRSDLPDYIEPVVLHALARNPEMRYQSADEFARVLNRASQNFVENGTVVIPAEDEEVNNNVWKTAFIVLVGIVGLTAAFIYATNVKQSNLPTTQMQADANGVPVQPLNPATGVSEQNLSNMMTFSPEMMSNSANPATIVPNGGSTYPDGINPWANGGRPPAGAPPPYPVAPGGQVIDPTNPNSIFMQDGQMYIPVPVKPNANVSANVKTAATPGGKSTAPAANTQQPATTNTNTSVAPPAANTKPATTPKAANTPAKPADKPADKPKPTTPAAPDKPAQRGKPQDS